MAERCGDPADSQHMWPFNTEIIRTFCHLAIIFSNDWTKAYVLF